MSDSSKNYNLDTTNILIGGDNTLREYYSDHNEDGGSFASSALQYAKKKAKEHASQIVSDVKEEAKKRANNLIDKHLSLGKGGSFASAALEYAKKKANKIASDAKDKAKEHASKLISDAKEEAKKKANELIEKHIGRGGLNDFYTNLYNINGGDDKNRFALEANHYLENSLKKDNHELKDNAIQYISEKLGGYAKKINNASHEYLNTKISDGINKISILNGGLSSSYQSYENNLKIKLGGTLDVTNQNAYNKVLKVANKKLDAYYETYKSTGGKSTFKDNVSKLVEEAKHALKKKASGGAKHVSEYISNYLNKKVNNNEFRGGDIDLDSETSTEFDYGNGTLSDNELDNLKNDYNEIIKEINNIDDTINNLIDSTNSSNLKENNVTFHDLIINRRILLETVKALEMKYNGNKSGYELDNAIELIGKDKDLRKKGEKKGLEFELDNITKEVFNLNLKLSNANDTLIDLIKLLTEKINLHTDGEIPTYDVAISHDLIKKDSQKGGASKESVIKQLDEISEKYIELVTNIKQKENFILGLSNTMILTQLKEYAVDLDNIIKKIHILNTRFTNSKIKTNDINNISEKLYKIDLEYKSYENRLNVILKVSEDTFDDKLKIEERDLNPDNTLVDKMILLRDNFVRKVNQGLIKPNEINSIAKEIDKSGGSNDQIDLLMDKLNSLHQDGGNGTPATSEDIGTVYKTINIHNAELQKQFGTITTNTSNLETKLRELDAKLTKNTLSKDDITKIYTTFLRETKDDVIINHLRNILKLDSSIDVVKQEILKIVKTINDKSKADLLEISTKLKTFQDQINNVNAKTDPNIINQYIQTFLSKTAPYSNLDKSLQDYFNQIVGIQTRLNFLEKSDKSSKGVETNLSGLIDNLNKITSGLTARITQLELLPPRIAKLESDLKLLHDLELDNPSHKDKLHDLFKNIDLNITKLNRLDNNDKLSDIRKEINKLIEDLNKNTVRLNELNLPVLLKDIKEAITIAKGTVGAPGPPGLKGDTGPKGIDGKDGLPGPKGIDGKDGLPGPKGIDGKDGPTGPHGIDGINGKDGPPGPHGIDGKDGLPGPKGIDGKDGFTGPHGIDGKDGPPGPKGDTGPPGNDATINAEFEKFNNELVELRNTNQIYQNTFIENSKKINSKLAEFDDLKIKLEKLETDIFTKGDINNILKNFLTITENQKIIDSLRNLIKISIEEGKVSKTELDDEIKKSIDSVNGTIAELIKKVVLLESDLTTLNKKLEDLSNDIIKKDNINNILLKFLRTTDDQGIIDNLRNLIKDSIQEGVISKEQLEEEIKKSIDSVKGIIEGLPGRVTKLEGNYDIVSTELSGLRNELTGLRNTGNEYQETFITNNERINSKLVELDQLKNKLNELSTKIITNDNLDTILLDFLKDTNIKKNNRFVERLRELIKVHLQDSPVESISVDKIKQEIQNSLSTINENISDLTKRIVTLEQSLEDNYQRLNDIEAKLVDLNKLDNKPDHIQLFTNFLNETKEDDDIIKHLRKILQINVGQQIISQEDIEKIKSEIVKSLETVDVKRDELTESIKKLQENYKQMNDDITKIKQMLPIDSNNKKMILDFLSNINSSIDTRINDKLKEINTSKDSPAIEKVISDLSNIINQNITNLNSTLLSIAENTAKSAASSEEAATYAKKSASASATASVQAANMSKLAAESVKQATRAATTSESSTANVAGIVSKLSTIADKILTQMTLQKETISGTPLISNPTNPTNPITKSGSDINNNHTINNNIEIPLDKLVKLFNKNKSSDEIEPSKKVSETQTESEPESESEPEPETETELETESESQLKKELSDELKLRKKELQKHTNKEEELKNQQFQQQELRDLKNEKLDKINKMINEEKRMIRILKKALVKTSRKQFDFFPSSIIKNKKVSIIKNRPQIQLLQNPQVEHKPVEHKPVEPKPVEPKPEEHKPVEPKPEEHKQVEPKQKGGNNSMSDYAKKVINSNLPKPPNKIEIINNRINFLNKLSTDINPKLLQLNKLASTNNKLLDSNNIQSSKLIIDDTQIDFIPEPKPKPEPTSEPESEELSNMDQNGGLFFFNSTHNNIEVIDKLKALIPQINTEKTKLSEEILNINPILSDKEFNILIDKFDTKMNILLSNKNNCLSYINNIINAYEYVFTSKSLESIRQIVDNFDQEINKKVFNIKKIKLKYGIDQHSQEFQYIFTTINRINIAIDLYKIILHAALHAKNDKNLFKKELSHGYDNLLTKTNMLEDFNKYILYDDTSTLNYNVWHMIVNMNILINNQIVNYNFTRKSVERENELLERKKEIIAEIEENPNRLDLSNDQKNSNIYKNVEQFIRSYSKNLPISNIKDELSIFDNIEKIENKHKNIKKQYINRTNNFPTLNEPNELSESNQSQLQSTEFIDKQYKIDDINNLKNDIEKYILTINIAEKQIKKIIFNYIAIKQAKKHHIELFNTINCKRDPTIFNFNSNSDKLYQGKVLNIYDNNGVPFLKIKEKNVDSIKLIPLNDCKDYNLTKEEKFKLNAIHNESAKKHAEKAGFKLHQSVICTPKLGMLEKYWHKLSDKSVVGKITKFTTYKDKLNRNRIKVEVNNKLYPIEECDPEFKDALEDLNDVKKTKFVRKQLEKLKIIIHQIDSLNPHLRDYDLKLKLLNKEYDHIKNETDKLLHPELHDSENSVDSITESISDSNTEIYKIINDNKDIELADQELKKLKDKRMELEQVLEKNNPKLMERLHPERTKIPFNLIHGGHKLIQHAGAGFHPGAGFNNYLELKQNINNVSLDSILVESRSLLNQLNK
jgi:chromosome segregation ATPase